MKSSFTNLMNQDVTKYLGYVPQNFRPSRTPASDDTEVNKDSRIDISFQGFQKMQIGENGKNINWTTDINHELPIKMGSQGLSKNLMPETISTVFCRAAYLRGDNPAMRVMRDNKELVWTWKDYYDQAMAFAKSLEKIGVEQRKVVNIMGFNSPEWAISYYGSILHNSCVSGVYTTNGPDACRYQAEHSEAQAVVVDSLEQFELYVGILDKLPEIRALVAWGLDKLPEKYSKDTRFYTFKDFLEVGKQVPTTKIEQLMKKQQPGQCAVLIYTSGTTGYPKGVMLSHDNLIFNATSITLETVTIAPPECQIPAHEHRVVSYLPLSHIAGL